MSIEEIKQKILKRMDKLIEIATLEDLDIMASILCSLNYVK